MLPCSILLLLACSLCSAIPTSQFKRADESSGVFNVLSIAIRDFTMPSIFDFEWDEKSSSATYIGQRLSQYDYGIVNIQEDFHFHDLLYRLNKHPFRTKDSGKIWYGSGLSTFSKYKWVDFSRTPWSRCGNPYDCFVSRGFTFMRVRIDQGVYIDMINLKLQANAGVEVKDCNSRRSNMRQLANFIDANSAGNAVLVFGDISSLYSRSIDKAIIHLLTFRAGLMDAWVQAIGGDPPVAGPNITCPRGVPPNISCEVGDKVLYRGSPIIDLKSLGFFYDTTRFLSLNPEGHPLTDHHPVRVEFEYTLKSGLRQSDLCGGPHGTWFNDLASMPAFPKLASITLRGCDRLNSLILTLTSGQTFTHGGSGGQPYSLNLGLGEYVQSIKLCWGTKDGHTRNFYALATTNKENRIYAGKTTSDCANATAPSGYGVVGAYGQDGDEIDQLGFIYAQH